MAFKAVVIIPRHKILPEVPEIEFLEQAFFLCPVGLGHFFDELHDPPQAVLENSVATLMFVDPPVALESSGRASFQAQGAPRRTERLHGWLPDVGLHGGQHTSQPDPGAKFPGQKKAALPITADARIHRGRSVVDGAHHAQFPFRHIDGNEGRHGNRFIARFFQLFDNAVAYRADVVIGRDRVLLFDLEVRGSKRRPAMG